MQIYDMESQKPFTSDGISLTKKQSGPMAM
jgi:hypothetical protein